MQVTTLDGSPTLSVTKDEDYLVPCVFGIPVICPSHIDEGTDGPTSRHWHVDDRFGETSRGIEFWDEKERQHFNMVDGDVIRTDIVKDNEQPVQMERMTATKNVIRPSGGVWTTVVWLYYKLGHLSSTDGCCAHHPTPLVEQDGCLACPAHALKYKQDGSPRYEAPFYISIPYIDWDHNTRRVRESVCIGHGDMKFKVKGNFDYFPHLALEDAKGECIMEMRSDKSVTQVLPGEESILAVNIGVWPSSGQCPSLVQTDPRNLKVN